MSDSSRRREKHTCHSNYFAFAVCFFAALLAAVFLTAFFATFLADFFATFFAATFFADFFEEAPAEGLVAVFFVSFLAALFVDSFLELAFRLGFEPFSADLGMLCSDSESPL